MVGSFIVAAIALILHLILQSLVSQFGFINDILPYTKIAVLVVGGIFLLFVALQIIKFVVNIFKDKGDMHDDQ